MVKLIITDMDGTFLDSRSSYNMAYFAKTLTRLQEKQIQFAACTGKHCERVEEIFGEHADAIWIVGDSATRIKKAGRVYREWPIQADLARRMIRRVLELRPDVTVIVPTETTTYVAASISSKEKERVRGSYSEITELADVSEWGRESAIKVTIHDPKGESLALYAALQPEFGEQAYIVPSEPEWLDITAHGIHKGTTINHLQEKLGISHEETMVFGDGLNDIELMACGKYSYAMANGAIDLKAAAKEVVASNDEDGVLNTINRYLDQLETSAGVSNRKRKPT